MWGRGNITSRGGNLTNDVTIIIKTFKRKNILFNECIPSIRELYPNIQILILNDDTDELTTKLKDITIVNTEFDIGLSEGRNRMIDLVETKYFLLLDDDSIFNETTNIKRFYDILENTNLSIVGGVVDNRRDGYWNIAERNKGKIYFEHRKSYGLLRKYNCYRCDAIRNFFLAKTETFKKYNIKWDPILKVGEHNMFFFNIWKNHSKEVKIGFIPDVGITQSKNKRGGGEYMKFRNRARKMLEDNLHRYGITYLKALSGAILKSK